MFRWFRVIVDPYGHRPFFEQGSGADRTRDLDQKKPESQGTQPEPPNSNKDVLVKSGRSSWPVYLSLH